MKRKATDGVFDALPPPSSSSSSPIPRKTMKNSDENKGGKYRWGEGVTTVTCDNVSSIEGEFMAWLKKAAFVAVDTEFSGLKTTHYSDAAAKIILSRETKDMESRYVIYKDVVTNHTLLSIGVSFWEETGKARYRTRTFSFLVMRDALTIEVSPQSLIFLATHGMDFNKLFSSSIPYVTPPPAPKSSSAGPLNRMMRALLTGPASVVFHNGFLDLLYLYHSFVGSLPENVTDFCMALSKSLAQVFDTRFIAERIAKEENASLGKVFESCWEENTGTKAVTLEDNGENGKEEESGGSPGMALHNADFDAYSTAFVFAFYKSSSEKVEVEAKDKIFLPGKNFPMAIPRQKPL